MDMTTLHQHLSLAIDGKHSQSDPPTNPFAAEAEAYLECLKGNLRLDKESIPQPRVDCAFEALGLS